MTRKTATIIGGCCAFILLFMGGCSILTYFGIKKAVTGYTDIQAKADARATAFLTAVGADEDSSAYHMLAPSVRMAQSPALFRASMKKLRGKTGPFKPPFAASGVNFQFNNDDRTITRDYAITGSKATATMTIMLHQLGSNPWEVMLTTTH